MSRSYLQQSDDEVYRHLCGLRNPKAGSAPSPAHPSRPTFNAGGKHNASWKAEIPDAPRSSGPVLVTGNCNKCGKIGRRRLQGQGYGEDEQRKQQAPAINARAHADPNAHNSKGRSIQRTPQKASSPDPDRSSPSPNDRKTKSHTRKSKSKSQARGGLSNVQWPAAVLENIVGFMPYDALPRLATVGREMRCAVARVVAASSLPAAPLSADEPHTGERAHSADAPTHTERGSLTRDGLDAETGHGTESQSPDGATSGNVTETGVWKDGIIVANACMLRVPNELFVSCQKLEFNEDLPIPVLDAMVLTVCLLSHDVDLMTMMSDQEAWTTACEDITPLFNESIAKRLIEMSFCEVDPSLLLAIRGRLTQRGADSSKERTAAYLDAGAEVNSDLAVLLSWFVTFSAFKGAPEIEEGEEEDDNNEQAIIGDEEEEHQVEQNENAEEYVEHIDDEVAEEQNYEDENNSAAAAAAAETEEPEAQEEGEPQQQEQQQQDGEEKVWF